MTHSPGPVNADRFHITIMAAPVVFWFRQDLRLADNPALVTANRTGAPVIAIYILHDETGSGHATGEASRWWLHHSLTALAHDLKQRDNCLLLRRGDPFDLLTSIIRSTGASELYFNCCYEPYQRKLEAEISEHLASEINIHPFASSLLFDPETIHTRMGSPFRVFTPFWKTCLNMPEPAARLGVPVRISGYGDSVESDQLADWKLLPSEPDWSTGFQKLWSPGESAAHERLDDFVRCGISHYGEDRDRPDRPGTSRLSPHLHFGEITPRQIWHKIRSDHSPNTGRTGGTAFLRELGWREFCTCLLYHWPSLVTKPFRPEFESFPWRSDAGMLARWQQGLTGYPMVDAGMRELWNTGRMHNRVRMITASFLVKDLLIHWQDGEAWFRDTGIDADLANNVGGWQWVAGCGADAAPWFRIFNPVLQGRKCDPQGRYVKQWIPELKDVPEKYVHAPWEAPGDVLRNAGVNLGKHYPKPVVDHAACRQRALEAYRQVKNRETR